MSITAAITEINSSASSAAYRRLHEFRALQRTLDGLIEEAEDLVSRGVAAVPDPLRLRAELAVERVHGGLPERIHRITAPSSLLDHLFVAEGRLRKKYYVGVDLDLDEESAWRG